MEPGVHPLWGSVKAQLQMEKGPCFALQIISMWPGGSFHKDERESIKKQCVQCTNVDFTPAPLLFKKHFQNPKDFKAKTWLQPKKKNVLLRNPLGKFPDVLGV